MVNRAVAAGQRRRRHVEALCRGGEQHFSRGSPHLSHDVVEGRNALAIAGEHPVVMGIAIGGIEWRKLDFDAFPGQIELVGQDRRERRCRALAHFRLRGDERHGIVGRDPDPRSHRYPCPCLRQDRPRKHGRGKNENTAARTCLQEAASRQRWAQSILQRLHDRSSNESKRVGRESSSTDGSTAC